MHQHKITRNVKKKWKRKELLLAYITLILSDCGSAFHQADVMPT